VPPPVPLSTALPTWIKVALLSFGGPAGQIGVMHRLLVDERRWVEEDRFLHAMSYCMLLPGPEAQQLATYLGWLLHGARGGIVAGTLFILPGLASIFALSVLYAGFRDTTVVEGVFFGLKPAVMAVVLEALLRMGRRTLTGRLGPALAAGAFVAIFFFQVSFPLIIVAAGALGYVVRRAAPRAAVDAVVRGGARPPAGGGSGDGPGPRLQEIAPSKRRVLVTAATWLALWLVPVALLALWLGTESVFVAEAVFFSKAAVVTFGGAYAVLAYIAQQAVEVHHWLAPGEMLDGLGMAETTPGPLIQVVQFVGFMGAYRNPGGLPPLAAGALGSLVTAWVTFVPCFLFVLVGAPFAERLRGRPRLQASLAAITAAIVGVVLNLAVWFSLHTVFGAVADTRLGPVRLLVPAWNTIDWAAAALALGAALAMLRYRVGMVPTLAVAALAGLGYRLL
jgi:chromate transporter